MAAPSDVVLARLRISQYALIDDVEVALGEGLNVLTGETGAGKSILIEGLEFLLGGRATAAAIREGSERATIEGLFVADGEETLVRRAVAQARARASGGGHFMTPPRGAAGAPRARAGVTPDADLIRKMGLIDEGLPTLPARTSTAGVDRLALERRDAAITSRFS